MDLRSEATGELAGHWMEDRQLQSARQTDGVSCGAFVLLNGLAISMKVDPASKSKSIT